MDVWKKYLNALDSSKRQAVLATLAKAETYLPGAEKAMSYAMPTLKLKGKSIISVAAWKNHLAVYPHGMEPAQAVEGKISNGRVDKSGIMFSYDDLPTDETLKVIIDSKLRKLGYTP